MATTQEETVPTTPVHRSLIRSDRDHILGAERALVVMLVVIAFILGWILMSVPTTTIAVLMLVIGVPALRAMAKRDPVFSRVLIRRLNQQREYLAHAHWTRTPWWNFWERSIPPQARAK
jgi:type IV secretory pathway TrbD component